jgi:predicted translin family RNA/ssDNA-binding protein
MANITLSVPEKLHRKIKKHPEIRWSEIARNAMTEYVEKLELVDKLTSKSRLTEKEAMALSKEIKRSIAEKHMALLE